MNGRRSSAVNVGQNGQPGDILAADRPRSRAAVANVFGGFDGSGSRVGIEPAAAATGDVRSTFGPSAGFAGRHRRRGSCGLVLFRCRTDSSIAATGLEAAKMKFDVAWQSPCDSGRRPPAMMRLIGDHDIGPVRFKYRIAAGNDLVFHAGQSQAIDQRTHPHVTKIIVALHRHVQDYGPADNFSFETYFEPDPARIAGRIENVEDRRDRGPRSANSRISRLPRSRRPRGQNLVLARIRFRQRSRAGGASCRPGSRGRPAT